MRQEPTEKKGASRLKSDRLYARSSTSIKLVVEFQGFSHMKHGEIRNVRMEKIARGDRPNVTQAISGDSIIVLSPYERVCECYCETCKKWHTVRGVLVHGYCPGCSRPWQAATSFAEVYC